MPDQALLRGFHVILKRLSEVDINPGRSNQHEIGGVRPLLEIMGEEKRTFERSLWITLDDNGQHLVEERDLTWYDSRARNPNRAPEWRIYYKGDVEANAGDIMIIFVGDDPLRIATLIAPSHSTWAAQIISLMGEPAPAGAMNRVVEARAIPEHAYVAIQEMLEVIRWDIRPESDPELGLADLVQAFGEGLPAPSMLSAFVRDQLGHVPGDPDATLWNWWLTEERLFRASEAVEVERRIATNFSSVEEFISYSLSVQNRRKSRAGLAFESHLEALFQAEGLRFARGKQTEGKRKPDFIFPGMEEYREPQFPSSRLTMLGAKTTCKERWRQILPEAARIPRKHLCTLEPAISADQLHEMAEERVTIVAPENVAATYTTETPIEILRLAEFIALVKSRQPLP